MKLLELAEEYDASHGGLVLLPDQTLDCAIQAARFYAAYGRIRSLTLSDELEEAPEPGTLVLPEPPDPTPAPVRQLPIKNIDYIGEDTEVSVGEWALIKPLFWLYAERENAIRLEASRAAGIEPYGRSVSEVQQDITVMENETLPQRAFNYQIITVGD